MVLRFDSERVRTNARQADTEDLLDRVTVYRDGLEPQALDIIEAELRTRGVRSTDIEAHAERRAQEIIPRGNGTATPCSFCHRPAVAEGWGWHRMWGVLPLFPRYYYYCAAHAPQSEPAI